ncbi:MAG TPA: hypothetical protein VM935_05810 [Chitinophagaceae bacterium]|nr:hypothetical protein [Chitinophagaceae bacterium]
MAFFLMHLGSSAQVQDTLPKFSVRNVGKNRIIIGWLSNYQNVAQISIQRGFDSIGIYKTVLSVADPKAVQNGFADTKAPNDHMFYRLFVGLEGGRYFFTAAKKPTIDTTSGSIEKPTFEIKRTEPEIAGWVPSHFVYTNKEGYVFINLPDAGQKKYRIKIFEGDGNLLFELKNIKETALTLDKANFYHAGWFNFELYNDEKLVEQNKFYLSKLF